MNVCAYLHDGPNDTGYLWVPEYLQELILPIPQGVPSSVFDQNTVGHEEHLYRKVSQVGAEAEFEYVGRVG